MFRRILLVAVFSIVIARAAAAQPRYTMEELPQLYGFLVADRNVSGTVVGTFSNPPHPFIARAGQSPQVLNLGSYGYARSVNRFNVSVGTIATTTTTRCYRWDASGIAPFRWLDPYYGDPCSASDINDSGTVVGGVGGRAFAMSSNETILLDVPGTSVARSINNAGMIAGDFSDKDASHLFKWFEGTYVDYGAWNGVPVYGVGITSKGIIAANAKSADGAVRFALVHDNADYQQLFAWANGSEAAQINNRGDVVGSYWIGTGPRRAFLYSGGVEYDLNSLIVGPQSSVTLFEAATIDDRGVILAYGVKDDCSFNDPCLLPSAFLLTPLSSAPLRATR